MAFHEKGKMIFSLITDISTKVVSIKFHLLHDCIMDGQLNGWYFSVQKTNYTEHLFILSCASLCILQEGRGKISALRLREVCKEYGVPVEDEVLLTLVDW